MPIYEFACADCRKIFSFLSKRVNSAKTPSCPKCGNPHLQRQISAFSALKKVKQTTGAVDDTADSSPSMDDPRMMRAMAEMERDIEHMDENNPRHMAHFVRKMKDLMPGECNSPELETAIKRLEAGEDPEKIEEDMGDVLTNFMGDDPTASQCGYARDNTLHDY